MKLLSDFMISRIYPDWEQISNYRTPLTDGELTLAKFLDKNLPDTWEIYIQPYLNGDKPDVAILNPSIGVVIFEVKDWKLANYHSQEEYYFDKLTNQKRKGKKFFVTDNCGTYPIQSPVSQVERYRENLINLYLPQIGNEIDSDSRNLSAFKVALYFHNSTTDQAKRFCSTNEKKCVVFGSDLLNKESIEKIVLDVNRRVSYSMKKDWADEIRFWLKPPFHSVEQGLQIKLTAEQKRHTQPSPNQHQRLRGVAGSGKTLVIAQRAANLASQGKRVLVVTYNITLWHYIRDHISRARFNFSWDQLEFRHFHGFCSNFLKENDIEWPSDVEGEKLFNEKIPNLVLETVKSNKNRKNRRYDAILIDEGQDFQKSYYDALCAFLTINNELLFVTDERQNIYKNELSWVDNMRDTLFKGRWRELKKCYRLPIPVLEQVNKFAEMFLPNVGLVAVPEIEQMSLFEPHLRWKNITSFEEAQDLVLKTIRFLTIKQGVHPQDIVILVSEHSEGWKLVKSMECQNIKVNHVFEDKNKSHHHKKTFWMGDSRLKMSTIHSFKGWEMLNVIILTPPNGHKINESLDSLLYVAITRPRQNLIVFNRNLKYFEYGEDWTNQWFIDDKIEENNPDDIPF
jgi:hypothetical protein